MTAAARRLTFDDLIERGLPHRHGREVRGVRVAPAVAEEHLRRIVSSLPQTVLVPREIRCPECNSAIDLSSFATNEGRDGRTGLADPTAQRITRITWLIARFLRGDRVTFDEYERRFETERGRNRNDRSGGNSQRSFRRDIAALKEAGFVLEVAAANRHGGGYKLLTFRHEPEAR